MPGSQWGGPYSDSAYRPGAGCLSLTEDCVGTTTAHGVPRYYEDGAQCRRLFWLCAFVGGVCAAIGLVSGTIAEFANAGTTSSISDVRHAGSPPHLPSVTVCHSMPVRCRCSAFYSIANAGSSKYFGPLTGKCTSTSAEPACQNWQRFVAPYLCPESLVLTECGDNALCEDCRLGTGNISNSEGCTHPDFGITLDSTQTRAGVLQGVQTEDCGDPSFMYKEQPPTLGDLYRYAGFSDRRTLVAGCKAKSLKDLSPTGDSSGSCMEDKYWDPVWYDSEFGACHTFNGATVDPAIKNSLFQHLPGGHNCGDGVSFMVDVSTHQLPAMLASLRDQLSPWAMIHIHGDEEKGALHNAIRASPGMALDIRIKKKVTSSIPFPYTNCTSDSQAIDPEACEKRCVSAMIASKCCGQDLDALAGIETGEDPLHALACSAEFSRERQQCIQTQREQAVNGQICKHPTDLNTWRLDKKGWYDTTTGDQKADVKQKALGGESRVYCPPLCNDVQYEPSYVVQSQALSEHAANTIARDLIASRQIAKMSVPSIDNAETCDLGCVRNLAAYVKKNFAVVNVVYAQFEDEVHTISPAVSVAALFGGIGGNLGLFVGASIMTIIEFGEYLAIALMSGVLFRCGYKKYTSDDDKIRPPDVYTGNQPLAPIIMETHSDLAPAPARSAYQFQETGPPQWLQESDLEPANITVPVRVTTPAPIYQSAPAMGQMYQQSTPISLYNSHASAQYLPQQQPPHQQNQLFNTSVPSPAYPVQNVGYATSANF